MRWAHNLEWAGLLCSAATSTYPTGETSCHVEATTAPHAGRSRAGWPDLFFTASLCSCLRVVRMDGAGWAGSDVPTPCLLTSLPPYSVLSVTLSSVPHELSFFFTSRFPADLHPSGREIFTLLFSSTPYFCTSSGFFRLLCRPGQTRGFVDLATARRNRNVSCFPPAVSVDRHAPQPRFLVPAGVLLAVSTLVGSTELGLHWTRCETCSPACLPVPVSLQSAGTGRHLSRVRATTRQYSVIPGEGRSSADPAAAHQESGPPVLSPSTHSGARWPLAARPLQCPVL